MRRLFAWLAALLMCGCSGPAAPAAPAAAIAPSSKAATHVAASAGENLYVANSGSVTVYPLGSDSPARSLKHARPNGGLVFDSAQNLFVGDGSGRVAVFPAGATLPARYIRRSIDGPASLAVDSRDRLYVDNYEGSSVTAYAAGTHRFLRKADVSYSMSLAVDADGYAYVAWWYGGQGIGVYAFSPGQKKLLYNVYEGGSDPMALGVNHAKELVTTNFDESTITLYQARSRTPLNSVSTAVSFPGAVAFDSSDDVYCACGGGVAEYSPDLKHVLRTISEGVDDPDALVVDSSGNLYVANLYGNSVTVYPPGSTKPSQTITDGVFYPNALAIGP
jgi:hypothetical protein